jgi:hypothetical protein
MSKNSAATVPPSGSTNLRALPNCQLREGLWILIVLSGTSSVERHRADALIARCGDLDTDPSRTARRCGRPYRQRGLPPGVQAPLTPPSPSRRSSCGVSGQVQSPVIGVIDLGIGDGQEEVEKGTHMRGDTPSVSTAHPDEEDNVLESSRQARRPKVM